MKIINLTQHALTPDQIAAGAFEPNNSLKSTIRELLTFFDLPDESDIDGRAEGLAMIAASSAARYALIGGAPFLMSALERELLALGVRPVYAFSRREVLETVHEDGTVEKNSIFRHSGWIFPKH